MIVESLIVVGTLVSIYVLDRYGEEPTGGAG
jgi:hypothetical protein